MMMLARAAENLYWMARYLERAENTARLINSTTHVLLDLPTGVSYGWTNLIEVTGQSELFYQHYPEANEEAIMSFLIEDSRNPSSIYSCVQFARENTRTLREILPAEMWERINSLYLYVRANATSASRSRRDRYMVLNNVIEQRHAIVGLVSGAMVHDLPYQIIKLGRNVERADMTSRIIDLNSAIQVPQESVLHEPLMERIWMSILNSLSAYQTYRRLISMHVRGSQVIEFLLHDMRFPRSIAHCLSEIESCLLLIPRSKPVQTSVANVRLDIAQHHAQGVSAVALHAYLDVLQVKLGGIHSDITRHYFHTDPAKDVTSAGGQDEFQFAAQPPA